MESSRLSMKFIISYLILNGTRPKGLIRQGRRRNINLRSKHFVLGHLTLSVDIHTELSGHGNFPFFLKHLHCHLIIFCSFPGIDSTELVPIAVMLIFVICRFESQSGHWMSWARAFTVFFRHFKNHRESTSLPHPSRSSPNHYFPVIVTFDCI
jgi:hypothetical protein